jgi:hypothetical protein
LIRHYRGATLARHERASFGDLAEPAVRNTIVNTVLSTPVDEQNHTHPPSRMERLNSRHVGLADRVALHLGLALITWSRRPRTSASRPNWDDQRARRQHALERAERERKAERDVRLGLPTR